jgi:hypothetical protein
MNIPTQTETGLEWATRPATGDRFAAPTLNLISTLEAAPAKLGLGEVLILIDRKLKSPPKVQDLGFFPIAQTHPLSRSSNTSTASYPAREKSSRCPSTLK